MKSFKSFKEWLFPNIFTQYHKDYDTYKDAQGKGILERFVEICGEYFDNEVVPEIDNIVDSLIDYDKNSAIYINYLWEMFGSFPYAYGVIVGIEIPTKENIQKWIQEDDHYPRADFRKLMRYILQLYRIRGSQLFFTVVGRLFNVEITVKELSSGLEDLEEADSDILVPGVPAGEDTWASDGGDKSIIVGSTGASGKLFYHRPGDDISITQRTEYPSEGFRVVATSGLTTSHEPALDLIRVFMEMYVNNQASGITATLTIRELNNLLSPGTDKDIIHDIFDTELTGFNIDKSTGDSFRFQFSFPPVGSGQIDSSTEIPLFKVTEPGRYVLSFDWAIEDYKIYAFGLLTNGSSDIYNEYYVKNPVTYSHVTLTTGQAGGSSQLVINITVNESDFEEPGKPLMITWVNTIAGTVGGTLYMGSNKYSFTQIVGEDSSGNQMPTAAEDVEITMPVIEFKKSYDATEDRYLPAVVEEGDDNGYIVAVYLDPEALDDKDNQHLVYSIYDPTSQVKAVWGQDCNSCKEVSVDIKFPSSLQETLFNGEQLNDAGKKAYNDFIRLIEKYLPINVRISETERTYGLIPDSVLSPMVTQLPSYNQQTTELFGGEFGFPVTVIAEVIFNNNGMISTTKEQI